MNRWIYFIFSSLSFPSFLPPFHIPFLFTTLFNSFHLSSHSFIYSLMASNSHSQFTFPDLFSPTSLYAYFITNSWTVLIFPQLYSELVNLGFFSWSSLNLEFSFFMSSCPCYVHSSRARSNVIFSIKSTWIISAIKILLCIPCSSIPCSINSTIFLDQKLSSASNPLCNFNQSDNFGTLISYL